MGDPGGSSGVVQEGVGGGSSRGPGYLLAAQCKAT